MTVACVGWLVTGALAQGTTFGVRRIEATGLHRFTVADVTRLSGLALGQSVGVKELDVATEKLVKTGLFTRVQYRVTPSSGLVTFDVEEETDWSIPVVFDNFIGLTDDDLMRVVRAAVPAFAGGAPPKGAVLDQISTALTGALRERNLVGHVSYQPGGDLVGGRLSNRRHVFSVVDPAPRICSMSFEGATQISESELLKLARPLIGAAYSRRITSDFVTKSVPQTYFARGYWKATFGEVEAKPVQTPTCSGAALKLSVNEGMKYVLDKPLWVGNKALTVGALNQLLQFTPALVTDESLRRSALQRIADAYHRIGYLKETAEAVMVFDDAAHRARLRIQITEGPQSRIG